MFIRCTKTRNRASGEPYTTYRLVQSVRVGGAVKQQTLLNLGSHFDLPKAQWSAFVARVDELLHGQSSLVEAYLSETGQAMAQRFTAQLIALRSTTSSVVSAASSSAESSEIAITPAAQASVQGDLADQSARTDQGVSTSTKAATPQAAADPAALTAAERFQEVDLDSIELVRPRSVGVEHAALSVMRECGFEEKLQDLGLNRPQIAAVLGNIVARIAHPASELATHAWLQKSSSLGELIGFDFEGMDLNRLYRASDMLHKHQGALQDHLFSQAQAIFGLTQTITLYDLTHTYFEGSLARSSKAQRGRSKESRSDCPLVTLAMALDVSGFARRTQVFAGNVSEPATLAQMIRDMGAAKGSTIVMDAGIASEANLAWLREQGLHYMVKGRLSARQFDPQGATELSTAGGDTIKIQRVMDAQGHALLYCHSPAREEKDRAIDTAKTAGYLASLEKLHLGLSKPRGTRDVGKIMERIGRAKQRFSRAAQHYEVEVTQDATTQQVTAITWSLRQKAGSAAQYPGVYCLRTTLVDQDDATLWRTYTLLTDLESVFRALKTDLGLRPVFHQVDRRIEGHLFISVLAYHFVHMLRMKLKAQGVDASWPTLRDTLTVQRRVTLTMQRRDGRTVHVRKATRPEPRHHELSKILGLQPNPGGTQRTLV